jgi:hypothetical protein
MQDNMFCNQLPSKGYETICKIILLLAFFSLPILNTKQKHLPSLPVPVPFKDKKSFYTWMKKIK